MLDAAARHALDRDGYALIPGALDRAWVERLTRAFLTAVTQQSGTQHLAVTPEMPEYPQWFALTSHPAVLAAAEYILSRPFHVRDLHGRNPLPGYGQQGLHADWPERGDRSPYVVTTALWMIDDFTAENGATRIVPGTHLLTHAVPKSLAQPLASHPRERIVTGSSGSVLILNGHVWHSGTRNRSRGPRRAAQMVIHRG